MPLLLVLSLSCACSADSGRSEASSDSSALEQVLALDDALDALGAEMAVTSAVVFEFEDALPAEHADLMAARAASDRAIAELTDDRSDGQGAGAAIGPADELRALRAETDDHLAAAAAESGSLNVDAAQEMREPFMRLTASLVVAAEERAESIGGEEERRGATLYVRGVEQSWRAAQLVPLLVHLVAPGTESPGTAPLDILTELHDTEAEVVDLAAGSDFQWAADDVVATLEASGVRWALSTEVDGRYTARIDGEDLSDLITVSGQAQLGEVRASIELLREPWAQFSSDIEAML